MSGHTGLYINHLAIGAFIESLAINTQVEAMKAANRQREIDNEEMAYGEDSFNEMASDLERLALDARENGWQ